MTEEIKQLEQKIQDIQFQLDDVKNTRDPLRANQRIDLLQQDLERFNVKLTEMNKKIEAFGQDDKFLEVFTPEEFKTLYLNSGLGAKEIADLMKKSEKFKDLDSTPQTINKIVNSERGSLELRSYLVKQFRFAISQRQKV